MRSIATAVFVFAVIGFVAGAVGCSDDCTEMACTDSSRLVFERPLTAPGVYTFTLRPKLDGFDKWKVTCEVTLPSIAGEGHCDDDEVRIDRACSEVDERTTDEASSAGCSSSAGISGVTINMAAPHTVEVRIERDGLELANTSVQPTYEDHSPNGPSCDDMLCSQASTIVPLDP